MQSKPFVGINMDLKALAAGKRSALSFVCTGYADSLSAVGAIPVLVPPLEDEKDLAAILERLDGFVLTGGDDLNPRNDGFHPHPKVRAMTPRREKFDRILVRHIVNRRMPILAIGVGMQLLNVALGGCLLLHIPEDIDNALPHRDHLDPNHRHSLVVEPKSIMEEIYGDGEIRVNSLHHMAIDEKELGRGLRVTARCPDGVVEAVESDEEDWLIIGTQFHPEAESASALDLRIFDEFVDGIRRRGSQRDDRKVA